MKVMGAAADPSPNRDPDHDRDPEPDPDPKHGPNPDPKLHPHQATGTEEWDEIFGFMFETLSEGC